MTDFVFGVYYRRFARKYGWQGTDYEKIQTDDIQTLDHSTIYAAVAEDGSYLAAIRIIEKMEERLPIERDFNVETIGSCNGVGIVPNRIFEVGRFAKCPFQIKRAGLNNQLGIEVVDELIAHALRKCTRESRNVWFASIDVNVLAMLRRRVFKFLPVGETVADYLGSPTTPVMLSLDRFREDLRRVAPQRYVCYFGIPIEEAA